MFNDNENDINERFCKTFKDKKQRYYKTWRFGDDMSTLSNANERGYEPIYIRIEGVKLFYIKFEEQKNEMIK